jgi:hypothetical protein
MVILDTHEDWRFRKNVGDFHEFIASLTSPFDSHLSRANRTLGFTPEHPCGLKMGSISEGSLYHSFGCVNFDCLLLLSKPGCRMRSSPPRFYSPSTAHFERIRGTR